MDVNDDDDDRRDDDDRHDADGVDHDHDGADLNLEERLLEVVEKIRRVVGMKVVVDIVHCNRVEGEVDKSHQLLEKPVVRVDDDLDWSSFFVSFYVG